MQQKWLRWIVSAALVSGMAVLVGCEGGGDNNDQKPTPGVTPANVAGTWQGAFSYQWSTSVGNQRGSGTDTVTLTITQNGNDITGSIDEYSADGFVDGNDISFSADKYKLQGVEVKLSLTATFDGKAIVNVNGNAKAKVPYTGVTLAEGTVHADQLNRIK